MIPSASCRTSTSWPTTTTSATATSSSSTARPSQGTSGTAADDWRTILVGGLNAGGKGYYALDITNPGA